LFKKIIYELITSISNCFLKINFNNHQNGEAFHHFDALDKKPNWSRFSMQNQLLETWLGGAGSATEKPGCTSLRPDAEARAGPWR
jgi:hypothetical protein